MMVANSLLGVGLLWFLIVLFVVPAVLQWLWNLTFPQLFRWPMLTYWQAFRIVIIADLLFGGAHFTVQNGVLGHLGF